MINKLQLQLIFKTRQWLDKVHEPFNIYRFGIKLLVHVHSLVVQLFMVISWLVSTLYNTAHLLDPL